MGRIAEDWHIGVVLIPGFSLMAFASTVEPLRSANLMSGKALYRWSVLSADDEKAKSSGGLEVTTAPLPSGDADFDAIVVCGGLGCRQYKNDRLSAFLRSQLRRGALIGAVSTASFVLARAGLLKGRRCTVHWDYLEAFREAYSDLDVREALFIVDRGVFTCAGGTAAIDLMLDIIKKHQGVALAATVSDQFIHGQAREPAANQRGNAPSRAGVTHTTIVRAVAAMEKSLDGELDLTTISEALNISHRQLERLFKRYLNSTPSKYYLKLRLDRARSLVQRTGLSVTEIAIMCGFVSSSHFTKCYRRQFGVIPREDRRQTSAFE